VNFNLGHLVALAYDGLRARLEAAGKPLGVNDMLIAAHAVSLDRTIATDNKRAVQTIPRSRNPEFVCPSNAARPNKPLVRQNDRFSELSADRVLRMKTQPF
jgi:hypothetical protein